MRQKSRRGKSYCNKVQALDSPSISVIIFMVRSFVATDVLSLFTNGLTYAYTQVLSTRAVNEFANLGPGPKKNFSPHGRSTKLFLFGKKRGDVRCGTVHGFLTPTVEHQPLWGKPLTQQPEIKREESDSSNSTSRVYNVHGYPLLGALATPETPSVLNQLSSTEQGIIPRTRKNRIFFLGVSPTYIEGHTLIFLRFEKIPDQAGVRACVRTGAFMSGGRQAQSTKNRTHSSKMLNTRCATHRTRIAVDTIAPSSVVCCGCGTLLRLLPLLFFDEGLVPFSMSSADLSPICFGMGITFAWPPRAPPDEPPPLPHPSANWSCRSSTFAVSMGNAPLTAVPLGLPGTAALSAGSNATSEPQPRWLTPSPSPFQTSSSSSSFRVRAKLSRSVAGYLLLPAVDPAARAGACAASAAAAAALAAAGPQVGGSPPPQPASEVPAACCCLRSSWKGTSCCSPSPSPSIMPMSGAELCRRSFGATSVMPGGDVVMSKLRDPPRALAGAG